ncbi:MAG: polyamine aminopropyltransferase [Chitinivibrionales bacterium]|nr:polyamine aminopropyltransferase [Chitinivibrionales bacterium]MBD3357072.1 polyamine aminopropyltransferase [Chitinivibrionales bacterium]
MAPKKKRVFTEALNPRFGYYYTVNRSLYKGKTKYQKIELLDTDEFGTVLALDNITQVAEKNEYQYHEPMVHPALCCHPKPRRVLVIGGGDGGILREVLKYPTVERVDFAELDGQVIDFSRKYLAKMNRHSFDDPRVSIHVTDGREWVENHPGLYDAVIMDMTDPFGPSAMLYTKEFFKAVKRSFRNQNGIFTMHAESPISRPTAFNCINRTLKSVFGVVQPIYLYIQMYAVLWTVALASDGKAVETTRAATVERRIKRYGIKGLKVFNGKTLEAMRVPYPYVEEILRKPGKVITDKAPRFPDHFTV